MQLSRKIASTAAMCVLTAGAAALASTNVTNRSVRARATASDPGPHFASLVRDGKIFSVVAEVQGADGRSDVHITASPNDPGHSGGKKAGNRGRATSEVFPIPGGPVPGESASHRVGTAGGQARGSWTNVSARAFASGEGFAAAATEQAGGLPPTGRVTAVETAGAGQSATASAGPGGITVTTSGPASVQTGCIDICFDPQPTAGTTMTAGFTVSLKGGGVNTPTNAFTFTAAGGMSLGTIVDLLNIAISPPAGGPESASFSLVEKANGMMGLRFCSNLPIAIVLAGISPPFDAAEATEGPASFP